MLKIGLTGGIGSGKSTVAAIFEVLGIPVYYADGAAKRLMNQDEQLKAVIVEAFGHETYINGQLNTKYLSAQVFSNVEKLSLLNSLVHPATLRDASAWMDRQSSAYVIKEAALIFESGAEKDLDYVIGVKASEELRIQRTMKRDVITRDEVESRLNRQMPQEDKLRLCNFVINNEGDLPLIPQVLKLHDTFLTTTFC